MGSIRPNQQRRQRSRESFDRKFDQWLETGRQFVDGVAGTRPGKRRSMHTERRSPSNLESVGRWVGDKLEWLMEDEDGWMEPWESESQSGNSRSKRPLEAISRRAPKAIPPSIESKENSISQDEWPDEASFRVDRWQRGKQQTSTSGRSSNTSNQFESSHRRPLPRSSRRRD